MKKRLIAILWCVVSGISLLYGGVYHVHPDGDDANPGTQENPWLSWRKGFNSLKAGDTLWIHGGVYEPVSTAQLVEVKQVQGSTDQPIVVLNVPGETPVLDLSRMDLSGRYIFGLRLYGCKNWKISGLTVSNVRQPAGYCEGIAVRNCEEMVLENLVVDQCGGDGYVLSESKGTIRVVNCDATGCAARDKENGNGFTFSYTANTSSVTLVEGCRAWGNLDDGFDCWENDGLVQFESCWSFSNGFDGGDGDGFKLGKNNDGTHSRTMRILRNCIAVNNTYMGYDQNGCYGVKEFFNCIAYNNDYAGYTIDNNQLDLLQNNLAYKNGANRLNFSARHSHNSWDADIDVNVTDNDFQSIDASQLENTRQADGSLPEINFLHLNEDSDLIDAGIDTGVDFFGLAPDIGCFEFGTISNAGTTGVAAFVQDPVEVLGEEYHVYDMSGRVVGSGVMDQSSFHYEFQNLATGIYVIRFRADQDRMMKYYKN